MSNYCEDYALSRRARAQRKRILRLLCVLGVCLTVLECLCIIILVPQISKTADGCVCIIKSSMLDCFGGGGAVAVVASPRVRNALSVGPCAPGRPIKMLFAHSHSHTYTARRALRVQDLRFTLTRTGARS